MKKIAIICFTFCISCFCYAQDDWKRVTDSLELESRVKADIVLSKFDTISGKKILYSLLDRDYYIIFQQKNNYKEYFVRIDSICNVLTIKEVENYKEIEKLKAKKFQSRNKRESLKHPQKDRQTIIDAFNVNQYSTSSPDATFFAGVPSYFVMKDENNKRYGENRFSSLTAPCPINTDLWLYLIKKLIKNIDEITIYPDM
ncbi:hypothetical protein [Prevotella koreensis]|uniref:hypothetical protein n=1 Tax=Prevotella koreensis TaxID=2490854 RepID=UPI0028EF3257|nr:hypothetical protein [Prevotella koreensis]